MRALFTALPSVGTESGKIELTDRLPHVFLGTRRAERTKPVFVVRAQRDLRVRVDMEVQTFLAVAAVSIPHKEIAFRHFPSATNRISSGGEGPRREEEELTSCTHARTRTLPLFCTASEANACTPDYPLISFGPPPFS